MPHFPFAYGLLGFSIAFVAAPFLFSWLPYFLGPLLAFAFSFLIGIAAHFKFDPGSEEIKVQRLLDLIDPDSAKSNEEKSWLLGLFSAVLLIVGVLCWVWLF